MIIVHLNTGARKGVIVELTNAKMATPRDFLETAVTNAFNRVTNSNLSSKEVMKKHFVNTYTNINYNNDNETFDLEDNMTTFSLGHKISNYIFTKENLSVAEIDSKQYDRIVSIDFETANSKRASVCSIGFVVEEQGNIIEEKEILVNPQTDFSTMNIRIHNIRPLDVQDSPTWDIAWKEVEKYITPSTLVIAHNLRSMELSCIRQECERYEMELPTFAKLKGHNKMAYDTLKIAKENLPDLENYKLNTLAEYFKIDLDHHNALSDAKACLELFHNLRSIGNIKEQPDIVVKTKKNTNPNRFHRSYVDVLLPTTDIFDESHELFGKKVIFTGSFKSISRKDASQIVLNFGGTLGGNSITKDTDYLVIANKNYLELSNGKMSTKAKKASMYADEGTGIQIISEDQFLGIVSETSLVNN